MKRIPVLALFPLLLAAACQSAVPVAAPAPPPPPPPADSPVPVIVVSPPATGPVSAPATAPAAVRPRPAASAPEPRPRAGKAVRAVLIVQNHESDDFRKSLAGIGDRISAAISGNLIRTIDPNDAIGTNQNTEPWGENMPLSSAIRLAENLDAPALVTASIVEASQDTPDGGQSFEVVMGLSLQAKAVPGGESLFGVTHAVRSDALLPEELDARKDAVYARLVERLVRETAAEFLAEARHSTWTADPADAVSVAFVSNVPGTDVVIDGVSYGTAGAPDGRPLVATVSKGVHNLRFDANAAGLEPYRQKLVKFQDGQTWSFVAGENAEGRRLRLQDRKFDALLRSLEQGRATDEEIRKLVAQGYAKYLSASHTRLDGMPQSLPNPFPETPVPLSPGVESTTKDVLRAVESF